MLKDPIYFKNVDFVLPTPLHWRRQLSRGFNQSADLLRALSSLDPSVVSPPAKIARISRSRRTDSQAKASRRERLQNLNGAFTVHGDVRGCAVGMVDDVCTTGATGNAMASALLAAGATRVHLYCLARTPAP
jgi:ComF family protein